MQPTYSTSDLARLTRGEHERALREAHYNRLESDGVSFTQRTTALVHQTRTMAAGLLAP